MNETAALYRVLGEPVRLRLLRVLSRERLNVTELTHTLGLAQSGVSRHLGLLKEAGLVVEEPEAGFTYYRLARPPSNGPRAHLWAHLEAEFAREAANPRADSRADDSRLQEVLRVRRENFDVHGTAAAQLVPGRSWAAWARALGHLLPPIELADLGCGEGYLTIEAARWASRVVAIDRSAAVLRRARALAHKRRVRNIVWKRGEIEAVPLPDAVCDVVLLSQALHHASHPAQALRESARILRPGGRGGGRGRRPPGAPWVRDRPGGPWGGG
jgi:ArsR family transcriptional regulator